MYIKSDNLVLRASTIDDADQLYKWWNDGEVMNHAGFPRGLGITKSSIIDQINKQYDNKHLLLIIELNQCPIGEMNIKDLGNRIVSMGVKVCVHDYHDKGYGTRAIKLLLYELFENMNYNKIILDTNMNNKRAQHVYEKIGFRKVGIRIDAWKNQLGIVQSIVDYELTKEAYSLVIFYRTIETNRLILRRFDKGDWKDLYEYLSDEEVVKYEPYGVFTEGEAQLEALSRSKNDAFWAVCLKEENNKLIGNVYFKLQAPKDYRTWELGYVFNRTYHHNGYATEACRGILDYAFRECNVHRVIARCNTKNLSSKNLMERLGMIKESYLRKPAFFNVNSIGEPDWHDAYQYAILEEEWALRNDNEVTDTKLL